MITPIANAPVRSSTESIDAFHATDWLANRIVVKILRNLQTNIFRKELAFLKKIDVF